MREIINNKKGFSLSELLMVVLILSLLVIIIGSGMGVVKDAYEKVTLKAEAQTLMATTIEKVRDEFRFAREIQANQVIQGTITATTFISGNNGLKVYFVNDEANMGITMVTATGETKQSAPVVTDRTMTNDLTTSIKYTYSKDEHLITATIIIYQKVKGGVAAKEYAKQEFKVKPINQ